ncbi:MAG: methyltransferase domain-containing protein, partial [Acidimicrobiia bacterium]|nr:methyltransferase domain-containing protein [Acidimicrobiia bacterium]
MAEELVRAAYQDDDIAQRYDRARFTSLRGRLGSDRDTRLVIRAIDDAHRGAPASILDVACGSGRITAALVDRYPSCHIVGFDGSLQMLETAAAKPALRSRPFVHGDAVALPFDRGSFEVVTAVRFVGHLAPEPCLRLFAEMARVARSLVVVDVSMASPLVDLRRRLERRIKGSYLGFDTEWTWRTFTPEELSDALGAAGLELVSMRRKLAGWSDARVVAVMVL